MTVPFVVLLEIFHSYGDVTIAGERLQNLDQCPMLTAFEKGGKFIGPQLVRFCGLYEGPPNLLAFNVKQCVLRTRIRRDSLCRFNDTWPLQITLKKTLNHSLLEKRWEFWVDRHRLMIKYIYKTKLWSLDHVTLQWTYGYKCIWSIFCIIDVIYS